VVVEEEEEAEEGVVAAVAVAVAVVARVSSAWTTSAAPTLEVAGARRARAGENRGL